MDQQNNPDPELATIGLLLGNLMLNGNGEFGQLVVRGSKADVNRPELLISKYFLQQYNRAEN